jgi:hypothetical protein
MFNFKQKIKEMIERRSVFRLLVKKNFFKKVLDVELK